MALINDTMQPGAAGQATPAMQPGRNASMNAGAPMPTDAGMAEDPRENAEPAIVAAMKALYEDGLIDPAIQSLAEAPMMAQGLADVVYELVADLDTKSGGTLPEEIMLPVATEVLAMIVEDGRKAGLTIESRDMALATQLMIMRVLEESGADVTEMRASLDQVDFDQIGQMIDQQIQQGA